MSAGVRTSVVLRSTITRNPPYACRDEDVTFNCEVMNGVVLQWVSKPDIPCDNPITFSTGDDVGHRIQRGSSIISRLVSVARDIPTSNLSSVLILTPPQLVKSVTVVCGNQLPNCPITEDRHTISITGKYMLLVYVNVCSLVLQKTLIIQSVLLAWPGQC